MTDTVEGRSPEEQAALDAAYARMIAEQRERELRAAEIDNEQIRATNATALEHLDPDCTLAQDLTDHSAALEEEAPQFAAAIAEAVTVTETAVADHEAAVAAMEAVMAKPDQVEPE